MSSDSGGEGMEERRIGMHGGRNRLRVQQIRFKFKTTSYWLSLHTKLFLLRFGRAILVLVDDWGS